MRGKTVVSPRGLPEGGSAPLVDSPDSLAARAQWEVAWRSYSDLI